MLKKRKSSGFWIAMFLALPFASCSNGEDCCVPPPEPTVVVKDWDPRAEVLIEGSIFTVSYNEVFEQPNWIRYQVRPIEKQFDRGSMQFYEVDSIITSDNDDYYNNPWDRGHLAPAAAFTDTYENLYATFSFLNCTLQKDQLNRGEWAQLEGEIRNWASEQGTLTVEINLAFADGHEVLPTGAHIPSGYTKKITFPNGEKRCFYFDNSDTTADWTTYEIDCLN